MPVSKVLKEFHGSAAMADKPECHIYWYFILKGFWTYFHRKGDCREHLKKNEINAIIIEYLY